MSLVYDPLVQLEVRTIDLPYLRHGDTEFQALVYQPVGEGPFPALINIHGGAWNGGSRLGQEYFNRAIAASGAVVVAVDFRTAPEDPYPAQVADANYAIRWLKAHAAEFNASPASIGGIGDSSGAHTLMLTALRPHDPAYAAVPLADAPEVDASIGYALSLWGVLDSHARYRYAKRAGREELVRRTEAYFLTEQRALEANPQTLLERGEFEHLPPLLIIQGTNDDNVPVEIPERFAESYRARGGSVELEWFPEMAHQFAKKPGAEADRAIALMKQFVARQVGAAQLAAR